MAADRLVRILGLLAVRDGSGTSHLCEVAAEVTEVSGAGVLLLAEGRPQATLCTTGDVSAVLEDAQYTLGEGPCLDAHRTGSAVAEPDLGARSSPWPAFTRRAIEAGVRAVFAFPIRLGGARLGALHLYRDRPGALSDDQHANGLVIADVAARAILAAQANASPDDLGGALLEDLNLWGVVHQAAGMVAVQLGVPVADALVRLRAHAFVVDRLIVEVARDVVDRRLRFDGQG